METCNSKYNFLTVFQIAVYSGGERQP